MNGERILSIFLGIIAVAMVAVLVSKNAQTGSVLTSIGNAFGGSLKAAVSPVTQSNNPSIIGG